MSMSSSISLAFRRAGTGSALHLPSAPDEMGPGGELPKYHAAPSRTEVAVVQPVLVSFDSHIPASVQISLVHRLSLRL